MSKEIRLGLKGQFNYAVHNYSSVRSIIDHVWWEIKYAWRRAWYGYDDRDVFSFDQSFRDKMIVCLKELDKTRSSVFNVPDGYIGDVTDIEEDITEYYYNKHFSNEGTSKIIQEIVECLKMSDEDYVEKQLYGTNIYDKDYHWMNTREDFLRIESVRKENQDKAFDMLKMFWDQLWD